MDNEIPQVDTTVISPPQPPDASADTLSVSTDSSSSIDYTPILTDIQTALLDVSSKIELISTVGITLISALVGLIIGNAILKGLVQNG